MTARLESLGGPIALRGARSAIRLRLANALWHLVHRMQNREGWRGLGRRLRLPAIAEQSRSMVRIEIVGPH
jgi:hypothetical protein